MKYKNINDYETIYMIRENNEIANNYMYEKYKPLINKLAAHFFRKYKNFGIDYDDLYQEGMYGLSVAINNFDTNEDTLFFTFALLCIKREMERLLLKSIRYKNSILNFAVSLDKTISDEGMTLGETVYSNGDIVDRKVISIEQRNYLLGLKYKLKDAYAEVYELKLNGFSNGEIATILDLKYKTVDNYLRSIKNCLKKNINNSIDIDFSML